MQHISAAEHRRNVMLSPICACALLALWTHCNVSHWCCLVTSVMGYCETLIVCQTCCSSQVFVECFCKYNAVLTPLVRFLAYPLQTTCLKCGRLARIHGPFPVRHTFSTLLSLSNLTPQWSRILFNQPYPEAITLLKCTKSNLMIRQPL